MNIVVSELHSTAQFTEQENLEKFLQNALANDTILKFETPKRYMKRKGSFDSLPLTKLYEKNSKKKTTQTIRKCKKKSFGIFHSFRAVSGKSVKCNRARLNSFTIDKKSTQNENIDDKCNKEKAANRCKTIKQNQASPFSDAFFPSIVPSLTTKKRKFIDSSFTVAFLGGEQISMAEETSTDEVQNKGALHQTENSPLDGISWTKKRIQASESNIPHVTKSLKNNVRTTSITLSKEMILNASIISQLDAKFIVINAGGIICLVDQVRKSW